jgi:hypothetical protein
MTVLCSLVSCWKGRTRILGTSERNTRENIWMKGKGGRWELHNEELHNFCSSSNVFRVIKSRRIRWTGHVGRTKEMKVVQKIVIQISEGKRLFGETEA